MIMKHAINHKKNKLLVVLMCSLLLSGCSYFSTAPSLSFIKDIEPIEYGNTSINLEDYIASSKYDSLKISDFDPYQVGTQTITYTLKRSGQELIEVLELTVVDTQSPTFIEKADETMIIQGDDFEVSNYFKAVDPVDEEVEVKLSKELDTSVAGVFKTDVEARDKNGNKNTYSFTLAIKSTEEIAMIEETINPKPSVPETPDIPSTPQAPNTEKPSQPDVSTPKPIEPEKPSIPKPSNKTFLFSDGYNMANVESACMAYISEYPNHARACVPIKENGVYKGMLARFD